jgi:phage tail sheath protein FI
MTTGYTTSTSVKRQALGLNYTLTDSDQLMVGWASQWDVTKTGSTIKGFHINSGAYSGTYQTSASATSAYDKTTAKFLVPLIGGFDGWGHSEMTRDLLDSSVTGTSALHTAYETALDTLRSTEDIDINLLAVPGVAITNSISTYAKELVEERADCFYIGDMPRRTSATAAALDTAGIDSNYMATYWPYVKFYDSDNTQDVMLPATAQALEAIAYTDQVAYPWFAPAGLNRGLLTDVSRAEYKLTQDDRETLYENKINPIATFAGQGIAIWGQKTLQTRDTALNRINVRRMMLYVEKVIAGAALYLDFEQNDETTWDRFKAMVQPTLDLVKIKRGITDFRVIMDETTNTPDMIERGQMVGQIYIKPTKTAEVILINFNLMAQGATFEE